MCQGGRFCERKGLMVTEVTILVVRRHVHGQHVGQHPVQALGEAVSLWVKSAMSVVQLVAGRTTYFPRRTVVISRSTQRTAKGEW